MGEPAAEPDPGKSCIRIDQDGQTFLPLFVVWHRVTEARGPKSTLRAWLGGGQAITLHIVSPTLGAEDDPDGSHKTRKKAGATLPPSVPPFPSTSRQPPTRQLHNEPSVSKRTPLPPRTSSKESSTNRSRSGHIRHGLARCLRTPFETSPDPLGDWSGPPSRCLRTAFETSPNPLGDRSEPPSR
jgi:hypothetical protein